MVDRDITQCVTDMYSVQMITQCETHRSIAQSVMDIDIAWCTMWWTSTTIKQQNKTMANHHKLR